MKVKMKENMESKLTKLPVIKRTQCVACKDWFMFERMLRVLFKIHQNRIDKHNYSYVCKRCAQKAGISKDALLNLSAKLGAESISQFF